MKKILFNDKFGLTKAVLYGRKTQTRRIIHVQPPYKNYDIAFPVFEKEDWRTNPLYGALCWVNKNNPDECTEWIRPQFKEGDVVAVAQSYKEIGFSETEIFIHKELNAGWNNKMFVRAEACKHQIRITNVRIQRLQDISDEDCLKEGVVVNEPKIKGGINMYYPCEYLRSCAKEVGWGRVFHTPREAFAHLINQVSGKDVWAENPYVFVYDFELIK